VLRPASRRAAFSQRSKIDCRKTAESSETTTLYSLSPRRRARAPLSSDSSTIGDMEIAKIREGYNPLSPHFYRRLLVAHLCHRRRCGGDHGASCRSGPAPAPRNRRRVGRRVALNAPDLRRPLTDPLFGWATTAVSPQFPFASQIGQIFKICPILWGANGR
jgi:hypothetical protein